MFFITVLIIIIIAATAPLFFNIKAKIKLINENIDLSVSVFNITILKKRYALEREAGKLFSLYYISKHEKKYVTSLFDIIANKSRDSERLARKRTVRFLLKRAYLRISAACSLGAGDAAATALLLGFIGIAASAVFAICENKRRKFKAVFNPLFEEKRLSLNISCIIKLPFANIIIGYLIYKITIRR